MDKCCTLGEEIELFGEFLPALSIQYFEDFNLYLQWSDPTPAHRKTWLPLENADGIDLDVILPLLEKENEDSVVTGGTESDECSDETVSGTEESGSNGGGGDYDDKGNTVQATQQIARPNLRNPKQVLQTYWKT